MPVSPAPLPDVRLFVDADLLGVGKALAVVGKDVVHPGQRRCPEIHPQTPDSVWLPVVGDAGWIAISGDKRIRYNPVENRLLRQHGVCAIFLTGGRNMTSWDRLVLLVRLWDAIEASVDEAGPWVKALTRTGLAQLRMRAGAERREIACGDQQHGAAGNADT
jgi:PIN like domain